MATLLVTGGAGFIGSCYVLSRCAAGDTVVNLDKLTYSGNLENIASLSGNPRHIFVHGDIGNAELMGHLLKTYQPDAIVNFAAESHVDRSIIDPEAFVHTNVLGTCTLLRTAKTWWSKLGMDKQVTFRFLHISTDEVFGALQPGDPAFTEVTPYSPNSPYSASKASSDHFVRAFHETYSFPTLITNCSNNYGPRQFPEKLIPLVTSTRCPVRHFPYMGRAPTSATGFMWKTIVPPFSPCSKPAKWEILTTSVVILSAPTFRLFTVSAMYLMLCVLLPKAPIPI